MTSRLDAARAYFDGFASNDHVAILALLTDDVVWDIYGQRRLNGKTEFDSEIENEGFQGVPELTVDRMLDAGTAIVVPHTGRTEQSDGSPFAFAACDILTFREDLICRVESYVIPT